MTIKWTFQPNLVPIDPVLPEMKNKMYKFMDNDNGHQVKEYFTIPFGSGELTKGFHFKCKLVANYNSQMWQFKHSL